MNKFTLFTVIGILFMIGWTVLDCNIDQSIFKNDLISFTKNLSNDS